MAQRSPYNDRYKVDSKGKTRKSGAAAKPKRAVADVTPAEAAKKDKPKPSIWSRAKSASSSGSGAKGSSAAAARAIESTPRMKQLRRIWWVLWIAALAVAVGILLLQQAGLDKSPLIPVAWAVWLVAMGGAFYLEFVPIRKERALAIEAAKSGSKAKKDKPEKSLKPSKSGAPDTSSAPDEAHGPKDAE